MKQSLAQIISNAEVMPEVRLIWLESPEIASAASPGQFIMVRCGAGSEMLLRRPLSIHQVDNGRLALLFSVVGKGTLWLSRRKAGESLDLFGPLGNGFAIDDDSKNMLLVAGGLGIAPLCFLAEHAATSGHAVRMLIGAATATQLCPRHLLPAQGDCISATEDGSAGIKGMITDFLPEHADWAEQIFACGPAPMYRNMAENFPQLNGKPVQVSLEIMMGCGLGVCYGCTIKTKGGLKQVCKDGPVFDLRDIDWE